MKRPVMRGKELQKAVVDYAQALGWRVAHFQSVLATRKDGSASWRTPVAANGKGFPDLLMVRGKQIAAVEIKGDGDTLKPEQAEWLEALQAAGVAVFVVTPTDWRDSESELMDELHGRHVCVVCGDPAPPHRDFCAKHLLTTKR